MFEYGKVEVEKEDKCVPRSLPDKYNINEVYKLTRIR